jgi:WD40 repeat protein
LATGGADGRARLWSVPDGVAVGEAMPHPAAVVRLVFRPDGRTLLSVSHSPTETRIWDVPSGTPAEPPRRHGKYADVHPGDDGRLALLADRHKGAPAVRLMDMRTGRTVVAMPPETSGRAAFHPPGERMAVSEGDDRIRLWDTAAGRPLGPPLPQPGAAEAHLGFAPDGRVLYAGGSGGAGGAVRSWRVPEPMEGRPATIRLRLQLLTQLTDVDSGSVRALGPEELDDLRRQLMRKTDAVPSGAE